MTKTVKHTYPMRIFIYLVICSSLLACNTQEKEAGKTAQPVADTVKVFVLKTDSAQKAVSLPGELIPNENVQVRAKVQGYIRKLNVDIGSRVSKGQVLAIIDAPEINTNILALNEKVQAAKAKYQSSKDYFDRINTASKADGVIAASEWQRTKNQMLADSSDYRAALLSASSLKETGDYLTIVAPFSGIISQRNIEVGSYVGSIGDKPLFVLEDNSVLRLRVAIPEVYTSALLPANAGDLTTRSLPDKKFKAVLKRKSGIIDNETRSEIWEFEVPNTSGELKAGGYADVKLLFFRGKPSFIVPASAVVTTLEKRFVTKVSNGITKWVDVRPGFNLGDKTELFGELSDGDTLVLKGNEELKPGTKIITALSKP
ncbi:MAG TPA: efflux RND transporter periplasmic adaptor subunit [Chitinophagaceae bacterium]|nr:efflux RND transporter periplasmic adaptor subunit [Chitinophagaceae bacterium]